MSPGLALLAMPGDISLAFSAGVFTNGLPFKISAVLASLRAMVAAMAFLREEGSAVVAGSLLTRACSEGLSVAILERLGAAAGSAFVKLLVASPLSVGNVVGAGGVII